MLKKLLTYLGSLLALIALAYIGQQLFDNWNKIDTEQINERSVPALILGACSYATACFLLSAAWFRLISALTSVSLSDGTMRSIYARSQIAKYIPGNVMQIAGRHVMINRLGVGHKPLAVASLTEIIGLVMASCSYTLIGSTVFGLGENYINQQQLYYASAGLAVLLVIMPLFRLLMIKYVPRSRVVLSNPKLIRAFFCAYLYYLLFFAIAGGVLLALVFQLYGAIELNNAAAIIATFAVSWLAGFITPGAPSGIGIRETILVVSLDKLLLGDSGVLIAVLFRFITIGGDVLFFIIAGRKTRTATSSG